MRHTQSVSAAFERSWQAICGHRQAGSLEAGKRSLRPCRPACCHQHPHREYTRPGLQHVQESESFVLLPLHGPNKGGK